MINWLSLYFRRQLLQTAQYHLCLLLHAPAGWLYLLPISASPLRVVSIRYNRVVLTRVLLLEMRHHCRRSTGLMQCRRFVEVRGDLAFFACWRDNWRLFASGEPMQLPTEQVHFTVLLSYNSLLLDGKVDIPELAIILSLLIFLLFQLDCLFYLLISLWRCPFYLLYLLRYFRLPVSDHILELIQVLLVPYAHFLSLLSLRMHPLPFERGIHIGWVIGLWDLLFEVRGVAL